MDHMGVLDASFVHLERNGIPLHVGSLMIFEGPAPTHDELKEALESRLFLVPRYRQKVRSVPLNLSTPAWVDDPHFNIDYHVRHTAVPQPGDGEQLKRLFSRIMGQPLDFRRPVWEAWLVEGLEGGRWALMNKAHHCMIDGMSGADITSLLLSLSPDAQAPDGPQWQPKQEPSTRDVMVDGVTHAVKHPIQRAGHIVDLVRSVPKATAIRSAAGVKGLVPTLKVVPPNRFGLNGPISPHRRWTWVHGSLDDVKSVRRATGATVNDVILAAITLGFREFLTARGEDVSEGTVTTMVPVSTRPAGQTGQHDNQVAAMFADLPVGIEDPIEVLAEISRQLADLKVSGGAESVNLMTKAGDFVPSTLLALGVRASARATQRSVSTVTTNIPGPQVPLYFLGHQMLENFPFIPLAMDVRITIGIFSYNGEVTMGITGDYEAMPDIEDLAAAIEESLTLLTERATALLAASTD